jgi:hypothetical protein
MAGFDLTTHIDPFSSVAGGDDTSMYIDHAARVAKYFK